MQTLLPDLTPRDANGTPPALAPSARRARQHGKGTWPKKIAILSDYIRLPYANGATFATQFLYRELERRGHEVTVIGPRDPKTRPEDLPDRHIALPSVALRNHPGVYFPLPLEQVLERALAWDFDLVLGQTNTELIELGLFLRRTRGIPLLCVNTVHLPSVYPVVLPEALNRSEMVHWIFRNSLLAIAEGQAARVYDQSDGLIVLSRGLENYWRDRGVTTPIHVIPRSVEPRIFDAPAGADPFPREARPGARLLVVCRHTREKAVERLLGIFARWIAPTVPEATLTLVGDGPDHDLFKRHAEALGVADRCYFPGEYPVTSMPAWYRHADLFTYASLSETYGQVVSEALWSRLPVVAFADGMGVSHQVEHEVTGVLVRPGPDEEIADWRFAREVVALLRNPRRRHAMAVAAERHAHERSAPDKTIEHFFTAFEAARSHANATRHLHRAGSERVLGATHAARWMAITGIVAGLGCLRPPAVVNRHGRRQPSWNDLRDETAGWQDEAAAACRVG